MKLGYFLILPLALILFGTTQTSCTTPVEKPQPVADTITPNMAYGFDLNNFKVSYDTVQSDWTLSHLLLPYNVSQAKINEAYLLARDSVHLNYIAKGKECVMLYQQQNDTTKKLDVAIYVQNLVDYFVFDFRDSTVKVNKYSKPVNTTLKELSAKIKQGGNLSNAISREVGNNNISFPLIDKLSGIYAWSIDFFHLQPNDRIKVMYEERSVDGKVIGVGEVKATLFNHKDHDFYAFKYKVDSTAGAAYYNEKAQGMKSLFLSAPLKYSRISSGYTKRRYLKMYGRWKAHLGTDYAAPRGTPIWTTADGIIVARARGRANGNYVKVKHNKTYSTQYLHMSRFKEGQKVGDFVAQGDIIGYVGSTGASTGPHVCYRFWKNGKQVDSRAQKFDNAKPMDSIHIPVYMQFMDSIKQQLDAISYPTDTLNTKPPNEDSSTMIDSLI